MAIKVTIWNEYRHEKKEQKIASIYPKGIHAALAQIFDSEDFIVRTATLDEPSHGLTDEVLNDTDVMIWWGHAFHNEVSDEIAQKVADRVLKGMGFICLHSGHLAKPFKLLMGTSCTLRWRQVGERSKVWTVEPTHPIAKNVPAVIELDHEEMYGERFDIPAPDELVFLSWYQGGDVFRSGCCYKRGYGKVFYFQPGHEEFPTYYNKSIRTVIKNAVEWAHSPLKLEKFDCPMIVPPLEEIETAF